MMEKSYDYIKDNFERIKEKVSNAAVKSGRNYEDITILGATKTVDADKINFAIDSGLKCIGENRVQELLGKYDSLNLSQTDCHFIGALQSNKIKYILDKVSLIHSIDNLRQVKEINRLANNKRVDILIEVNIGNEETKNGIKRGKILEFVEQISEYPNISLKGLMCIPPICESKKENFSYFSQMYKYYIDISAKKLDNNNMSILSMGMSDDFEEAILAGSSLVRVGSALFGKRL